MHPSHTSLPSQSCNTATEHRDPATVLAASTFSAGLLLLPEPLQTDVRRLYYMLRTIDDLVDENDPQAAERVEAIERWATGIETSTPETRTLQKLATRYPVPPQTVADFCEGMRQDLDGIRIENETDLDIYCHRVAGTVGIMLAAILGTTHPDGVQKMETLGRAMQRTNIVRDIDEDLANGRVYIPRTAIERFGVPTPEHREALLRDQIARADALYEDGMQAIPMLANGRAWMAISATLYREYLRQIERDGFGRKPGRVTIPAWRKHVLIAQHQTMKNSARHPHARH
jgi:15-cis-phytoene synthase